MSKIAQRVNHACGRAISPGTSLLLRHFRDGDAAHAMSPVGGVGINLAIQDAVAASDGATEDYRACVE